MELITGENDKGRRLDRILRKSLPDHPLPLIHRLLRQKQVLINGKPGKAQDRIDCGAIISIPALNDASVHNNTIHSLPNPEIIWEGCGLLAVNKPPGLAVHGVDSLDAMVQSFLAGKLPVSLSFKSGPLHRLDKPSSGIVVFSTSLEGARLFSSLLHDQKVQKNYLAIVEGKVKKEEIWQDKLIRDIEKKKTFISKENSSGKIAITKVTPLAANDSCSLIKAEIVTGRTHQIRVQAASRGHPLLGDVKYRKTKNNEQRTMNKGLKADFYLHAWKLEFLEYSIEATPPQEFLRKIEELFSIDLTTKAHKVK